MGGHYGVLKCYLACENWQPKDQSQGCSKDHEIHSGFPHEANLEGRNSHQHKFVLSECGASQGRQSSSYHRYNLPNARTQVRWLLTLPKALVLGIYSLFLSFHVGEVLASLPNWSSALSSPPSLTLSWGCQHHFPVLMSGLQLTHCGLEGLLLSCFTSHRVIRDVRTNFLIASALCHLNVP